MNKHSLENRYLLSVTFCSTSIIHTVKSFSLIYYSSNVTVPGNKIFQKDIFYLKVFCFPCTILITWNTRFNVNSEKEYYKRTDKFSTSCSSFN